jgi:hypothetical protein
MCGGGGGKDPLYLFTPPPPGPFHLYELSNTVHEEVMSQRPLIPFQQYIQERGDDTIDILDNHEDRRHGLQLLDAPTPVRRILQGAEQQ